MTEPVNDPTTEPLEPEADPPEDTLEPEPETFPRHVVEELRRESARYRDRAKHADDLADRLMHATVREATAGILADSTDLPTTMDMLDEDGFPDPELIANAARELVTRKPHLGDRRPRGDADQGPRTTSTDVDLAGMLRART